MRSWAPGILLVASAVAAGQCTPQWTPLTTGCNWDVAALVGDPFRAPGSPRLLVAGYFGTAGSIPSDSLAAWDGWRWSTDFGYTEVGFARCMKVWSAPGEQPYVYLGGDFSNVAGSPVQNVARWDGFSWSNVGGGVPDFVYSFGMYNDGGSSPGALYLGGSFKLYKGVPANSLLRWDGVAWSALPVQLIDPVPGAGTRPSVYAMTTFDDDGPGPRVPGLYVAGNFKGAGAIESEDIVRWDGKVWEGLAGGTGSTVYSLCVFDEDGPGPSVPALFVSGSFNVAGGVSAPRFARWDGHTWSQPPGTALNANAQAMLVWDDDGAGPNQPALYATGYFGIPSRIARWRGQGHAWETLDAGLSGGAGATYGLSLAAFDEDGPGPNPGGLYVGGQFTFAGGMPANYIARWGCPLPPGGPCYPDCNSDGSLNLADFGCFTTKFALSDPYGDCNGDSVRNLSDFGCFTTKFALGCP